MRFFGKKKPSLFNKKEDFIYPKVLHRKASKLGHNIAS
jgi:hypothetical protein